MNDRALTTTQKTDLTSSVPDFFEKYGQAVTPRGIDGKLMKFSKGDFLAGPDSDEIPRGTQMVAVMDSALVGWQRWHKNQLTDTRCGRIIDGYQPPRRYELGDDDESKWEASDDGSYRDPWAAFNAIVFIDPEADNEIYTFSTSSRGGIAALGELCKAHAKASRVRLGRYPLISLENDSYQHKDKSYGRIKFPVFRVQEFVDRRPYDAALAASRGEPAPTPAQAALTARRAPPRQADSTLSDAIDDDIPF